MLSQLNALVPLVLVLSAVRICPVAPFERVLRLLLTKVFDVVVMAFEVLLPRLLIVNIIPFRHDYHESPPNHYFFKPACTTCCLSTLAGHANAWHWRLMLQRQGLLVLVQGCKDGAYGSFRKLGVPYFGVLIIRILLFSVLDCIFNCSPPQQKPLQTYSLSPLVLQVRLPQSERPDGFISPIFSSEP